MMNYLKNEKHAKWNDELVQVMIKEQFLSWQMSLVYSQCLKSRYEV